MLDKHHCMGYKIFKVVAAKRTEKREKGKPQQKKIIDTRCKGVDNSLQSRLDYSHHHYICTKCSPDIPTNDLHV